MKKPPHLRIYYAVDNSLVCHFPTSNMDLKQNQIFICQQIIMPYEITERDFLNLVDKPHCVGTEATNGLAKEGHANCQ